MKGRIKGTPIPGRPTSVMPRRPEPTLMHVERTPTGGRRDGPLVPALPRAGLQDTLLKYNRLLPPPAPD
jgi:hypothetical protein